MLIKLMIALLLAEAHEYKMGEELYNWSLENKDSNEKISLVENSTIIKKEQACPPCFPLEVYQLKTAKYQHQTAYVSRLPVYRFDDYWSNNTPLPTYFENSGYFGKISTQGEEKFEHGFQKQTKFEKGASITVRSESGGIISITSLVLPNISLQEGYLFAKNWMGKWLISEHYSPEKNEILFELSGELSCSDGGYAKLVQDKENRVLIELKIACD